MGTPSPLAREGAWRGCALSTAAGATALEQLILVEHRRLESRRMSLASEDAWIAALRLAADTGAR